MHKQINGSVEVVEAWALKTEVFQRVCVLSQVSRRKVQMRRRRRDIDSKPSGA